MKQTKPYGRSHNSTASHEPSRRKPHEERSPSKIPAAERSVTKQDAAIYIRPPFVSKASKPLTPLAVWSIKIVLFTVGVVAYVVLRDSMFVQNVITMVSSKETVMTCLSGQMHYEEWSVWDRLWGNGRFICTEWRFQERFGNFPRF